MPPVIALQGSLSGCMNLVIYCSVGQQHGKKTTTSDKKRKKKKPPGSCRRAEPVAHFRRGRVTESLPAPLAAVPGPNTIAR